MISFALLLAIGLISGFLASTPLGPINLLIAHSVLSNQKPSYAAFLTGVILTDVAFAAMAFLGWATFFSNNPLQHEWEIVGGIIIILFGVFFLRKSVLPNQFEDVEAAKSASNYEPTRTAREFLKGVILCGVNPGFIVFWVYIASQIQKYRMSTFDLPDIILLLLGVVLGNLLWFRLYIWILYKGSTRFKNHTLKFVRLGISLLLMVLGAFTVFNA